MSILSKEDSSDLFVEFRYMNLLKSLGTAFWYSLYPPYCLHCESAQVSSGIFCTTCQSLLELIDPVNRCRFCFTLHNVSPKWNICAKCRTKTGFLKGFAAPFDDIGPAFDLLRMFRSGKNYLSESLSGYMYIQYLRMNWPVPDLVVPVAGSFYCWLKIGYHPSVLLAKEMGKYFQRPVCNILSRDSYQTEEPRFSLKKQVDIRDRIVLLIDDWYDSGQTIAEASAALRAGAPKTIYGMTATRKME